MKKLLIVPIILLCSFASTIGQKISVVEATRQRWSGGVVGNYGTNYSISIKSEHELKLDSLYIDTVGMPIKVAALYKGNAVYDSINHIYKIYTSINHVGGPNVGPPVEKSQANATNMPLRHYSGQALIVYHYRGRKHLFVIRIIDELRPLAYP